MSDVSRSSRERQARPLRQEEIALIEAALGEGASDLSLVQAVDLDDGSMGSIRIHRDRENSSYLGSEIARMHYIDDDGVPVSITLNSDQNGFLFEIDLWKVNFSPLIAYPRKDQLIEGDP